MTRKLLLCDCGGTQTLDRNALAAATGMSCPAVANGLCTHQIDRAAAALRDGGEVIVACRQEAETFAALAEELERRTCLCIDIRDRAGWSDDGAASDAEDGRAARRRRAPRRRCHASTSCPKVCAW